MNFVVFALPRSRTAWLSRFLGHGARSCVHDMSLDARSQDDLRQRLNRPLTGTVDSALALLWPEIMDWIPNGRFATVRRPIEEVRQSAIRHGYTEAEIAVPLVTLSRCLDEIERDPQVLRVEYRELDTEDGCRRLFEHCTGDTFPRLWWELMRHRNIQVSKAVTVARGERNRDGLRATFGDAWARAGADKVTA